MADRYFDEHGNPAPKPDPVLRNMSAEEIADETVSLCHDAPVRYIPPKPPQGFFYECQKCRKQCDLRIPRKTFLTPADIAKGF